MEVVIATSVPCTLQGMEADGTHIIVLKELRLRGLGERIGLVDGGASFHEHRDGTCSSTPHFEETEDTKHKLDSTLKSGIYIYEWQQNRQQTSRAQAWR